MPRTVREIERITAYLSHGEARELKAAAQAEGRTLSAYIARAARLARSPAGKVAMGQLDAPLMAFPTAAEPGPALAAFQTYLADLAGAAQAQPKPAPAAKRKGKRRDPFRPVPGQVIPKGGSRA